jgi:hypothetical protein
MRPSLPFYLGLVAVLTACAATTPVAVQTLGLWQGVKAATVCCESKAAAMRNAQPLTMFRAVFDPSTPHFDFGSGLAPFIVFSVGESAKVLEVESPAQRLSMPQGGDGVVRYFDAKLIFVDAQGQELSGELIAQAQRTTVAADRSLFLYARVPSAAQYLILTTDPKKNREHHVSRVRQAPEERLTSHTQTFFVLGGIMPDGHKSASYGPVSIRVLPNQ